MVVNNAFAVVPIEQDRPAIDPVRAEAIRHAERLAARLEQLRDENPALARLVTMALQIEEDDNR